MTGPAETTSGGYFSSLLGDVPGSLSGAYFLCGDVAPGHYTVAVTVTEYDSRYTAVQTYSLQTGGFDVDVVRPRGTVKITPLRADSWKITGRLTGLTIANQPAKIQLRWAGRWRTLKSKRTNRRGVVVFTSTPQPDPRFKAADFQLRIFWPNQGVASRTFHVAVRR